MTPAGPPQMTDSDLRCVPDRGPPNPSKAGNVVWQHLEKSRADITPEEIAAMGRPWQEGSAEELVRCLKAQSGRKADSARRSRTRSNITGIVCMVLAAGAILAGALDVSAPTAIALLLAGPMLSSVAGVMLRDVIGEDPAM